MRGVSHFTAASRATDTLLQHAGRDLKTRPRRAEKPKGLERGVVHAAIRRRGARQ